MLVLNPTVQHTPWPEAGMTLDLIPLPEDKDQEFIQETLKEERDDKGAIIRMNRDTAKYAQLVGRYCIKSWTGAVVDPDSDEPALCNQENIDRFMAIDEAQVFVFNKVKGIGLHIKK